MLTISIRALVVTIFIIVNLNGKHEQILYVANPTAPLPDSWLLTPVRAFHVAERNGRSPLPPKYYNLNSIAIDK
ncbi:MAG: hypothetical protein F6K08_33220 [Okeania sp. SIO1H6]|nr:hypothetical protein [Okeania sp. SIO1H6]